MLHPENGYDLVNLSLSSIQGDSVVAQWFGELGVTSTETADGVHVQADSSVIAIPKVYDVADHLDLVPVMAALAALLPADFTFLHTRNLSYKESDRASALKQLHPFCKIFDLQEDSLHIVGNARSSWPHAPYAFSTFHDHRLAMAFLLFGSGAHLDDVDCLSKSYPKLAIF